MKTAVGILAAVALALFLIVWAARPGFSPPPTFSGSAAEMQSDVRESSAQQQQVVRIEEQDTIAGDSPSAVIHPENQLHCRRMTTVPKLPAEQETMITACLIPQAMAIGASLEDKYTQVVKSLTDEQKLLLDANAKSLAWDLAQFKVGWEIAINSAIQEYVRKGQDIPAHPDPSDKKHYFARGMISWGAQPGLIWGPAGTYVEIPFALSLEDHPNLAKAWEQYDSTARSFYSVFHKDSK